MRLTRAMMFGAIAITVAACYGDPEKATTVNKAAGNVAYTRFVNAVNDTGALDFHFVDEVSQGSPLALALPYRSFSSYQITDITYQGKARVARAFYDSVNVAQSVTVSTTQVGPDFSHTFTAGNYYTIILLGPSKTGAKWIVVQDNSGNDTTWASVVTDTTNIAARVINLTAADGTGETITNVMLSKDTVGLVGPSAFPAGAAAAALTAVAPLTADATLGYSKIAIGSTYAGAAGAIFDTLALHYARATGTTATTAGTWTNASAYYSIVPPGVAASKVDDLTAIGGVAQGGTAMSIYVFAPVVAGTAAPCTGAIAAGTAAGCTKAQTNSFRNYATVFVIDHNPSPVGWF